MPAFLAAIATWVTGCNKTEEQPDDALIGDIEMEIPKDTSSTKKQFTLGAPMHPDSMTTVMPPPLDSHTLVGEIDPRCIPKDSVAPPPEVEVQEAPKAKTAQLTIPSPEEE